MGEARPLDPPRISHIPSAPAPSALSFAPLPIPSEPSSPDDHLTLIFDPDHPCFTCISDGTTKKLLFIVESEVIHEPLLKSRTVTSVRRLMEDAPIAQFDWRDVFSSDKVALTPEIAGGIAEKSHSAGPGKALGNGGEGLVKMSASAWLKKSSLPFKDTVKYHNAERKGYKWTGFAPGLSLELYSAECPSQALPELGSVASHHVVDCSHHITLPITPPLPAKAQRVHPPYPVSMAIRRKRRTRDKLLHESDFSLMLRPKHVLYYDMESIIQRTHRGEEYVDIKRPVFRPGALERFTLAYRKTKIFMTDVTSYIGSSVLAQFLKRADFSSLDITALVSVESPDVAMKLEQIGVKTKIKYVTSSYADDVEKFASEADFVLSMADSDNLETAKAVLKGLKKRYKATRKVSIYIHTSGTGE
ncbi:hypothetical protein H0H81_012371 [Sphagnurus paluster]|uniref:DUF6593 domain-containing protein n=1 Tax=Sphagnurus paluster TaxID=117069 RepID=A0A9P7GJE8_9AGAR|nr:hypothetical protein H0H81_012371 [Sphagnurus paluster]